MIGLTLGTFWDSCSEPDRVDEGTDCLSPRYGESLEYVHFLPFRRHGSHSGLPESHRDLARMQARQDFRRDNAGSSAVVSVSTKEAVKLSPDQFFWVVVRAGKLTVRDGFSADGTRRALRSHRIWRTTRPGRNLSIEMAIITFLRRTCTCLMKLIDNRREKRGISNELRPTRTLAARPNRS